MNYELTGQFKVFSSFFCIRDQIVFVLEDTKKVKTVFFVVFGSVQTFVQGLFK